MYACEQGNLCRLVTTYAFLRREIWTERKNERVKHRRSEAKPDSYIGHDCLAAKFFHARLLMLKEQKEMQKEKEKFIRQYPLCYYSRRGGWCVCVWEGGVSVTGCGPSRGVMGSKIGHRINTCSCKIARV